MPVFDVGIPTLLLLALAYFLTFSFFCRIWARPFHPEKCTVIGLLMGFLYTFWFIWAGLAILIIIWLIWRLLPATGISTF